MNPEQVYKEVTKLVDILGAATLKYALPRIPNALHREAYLDRFCDLMTGFKSGNIGGYTLDLLYHWPKEGWERPVRSAIEAECLAQNHVADIVHSIVLRFDQGGSRVSCVRRAELAEPSQY